MGSSILVGIGSTKFIGVIVLAFAPSTLFRLYYFRMYLCIVVLGLFNGLLLIPLLLSRFGPANPMGNPKKALKGSKSLDESSDVFE